MAKYKQGDQIRVNGTLMTLGSWPASDEGPFTAHYTNKQGGLVTGTYWTGMVDEEHEQVQGAATVELVQPADGLPQSTAEDPSAILAEEQAALAAQQEGEAVPGVGE